ncbi:MAG: hypothetical protein C0485_18985 [Pirellula sp.]|nr:hypothetical protein [Pirellula sp.]
MEAFLTAVLFLPTLQIPQSWLLRGVVWLGGVVTFVLLLLAFSRGGVIESFLVSAILISLTSFGIWLLV